MRTWGGQAYTGAIDLLPTYAITYNNIGVLLAKQGRTEEALAHYQAALTIDGNYADAKNNAAAARSVLKVRCALLQSTCFTRVTCRARMRRTRRKRTR